MFASLRFTGVAALGVVLITPLSAQRGAIPPTTFAITNARLVPVSGPVIEKGTIVMRNGLIAAIGATVAVPADARVLDGTGLSVYPGFIEAFGSLGYAAPAAAATGAAAAAAGGRGGGRGGAGAGATTGSSGAPNSSYPLGFQPELNAVDELDDGANFDAAHGAGFTTAFTSLAAGGFRGTSAIINLRADNVADMVLKSPLMQTLSFSRGAGGGRGGGGGGGGYPGSLMGVISQLRQELFDAQHYRDLKAAYAKSPLGAERPRYDPSLEALLPAITGQQQVIMVANSQREIERALDLAKEFGLKMVIAGGTEAYKLVDRLKAANVPVILSVNFPRRPANNGGSDADPEPIQTMRERAEQPKAPALLSKTGVKFAFYAGSNWADYLANVRRAVDAGLLTDIALKAMTTTPAEMFGVADRTGTLEVGKIANLTIMRGDLFDKASTISQLYIDGRPVSIVAGAAGGQGNAGGRGGMSGNWGVNLSLDGVNQQVTFTLQSNDGHVTGFMQGGLGFSEILDGEIDDAGHFIFSAPVRSGGVDADNPAIFTGAFMNGVLEGNMQLEGHRIGSFTNRRSN